MRRRPKGNNVSFFKNADDMTVMGLFFKDATSDGDSCFKQANNLQEWCRLIAFHINVDKTKELIINGKDLPMSQQLSLNQWRWLSVLNI
jgi:hypothetical protein